MSCMTFQFIWFWLCIFSPHIHVVHLSGIKCPNIISVCYVEHPNRALQTQTDDKKQINNNTLSDERNREWHVLVKRFGIDELFKRHNQYYGFVWNTDGWHHKISSELLNIFFVESAVLCVRVCKYVNYVLFSVKCSTDRILIRETSTSTSERVNRYVLSVWLNKISANVHSLSLSARLENVVHQIWPLISIIHLVYFLQSLFSNPW